jgi:hypothetical protein
MNQPRSATPSSSNLTTHQHPIQCPTSFPEGIFCDIQRRCYFELQSWLLSTLLRESHRSPARSLAPSPPSLHLLSPSSLNLLHHSLCSVQIQAHAHAPPCPPPGPPPSSLPSLVRVPAPSNSFPPLQKAASATLVPLGAAMFQSQKEAMLLPNMVMGDGGARDH